MLIWVLAFIKGGCIRLHYTKVIDSKYGAGI